MLVYLFWSKGEPADLDETVWKLYTQTFTVTQRNISLLFDEKHVSPNVFLVAGINSFSRKLTNNVDPAYTVISDICKLF